MRLYYILNKPHEALEAMRNPETTLIFKELSSFIILCDLLYENKMYMEVLEVFDLFSNKPFHKFPQNIIIVSFASCYKLVGTIFFPFNCNITGGAILFNVAEYTHGLGERKNNLDNV